MEIQIIVFLTETGRFVTIRSLRHRIFMPLWKYTTNEPLFVSSWTEGMKTFALCVYTMRMSISKCMNRSNLWFLWKITVFVTFWSLPSHNIHVPMEIHYEWITSRQLLNGMKTFHLGICGCSEQGAGIDQTWQFWLELKMKPHSAGGDGK